MADQNIRRGYTFKCASHQWIERLSHAGDARLPANCRSLLLTWHPVLHAFVSRQDPCALLCRDARHAFGRGERRQTRGSLACALAASLVRYEPADELCRIAAPASVSLRSFTFHQERICVEHDVISHAHAIMHEGPRSDGAAAADADVIRLENALLKRVRL